MVVILVVFTRELSVADHLIVDYCCQRNQALELLFDPTSLGSNHPQALWKLVAIELLKEERFSKTLSNTAERYNW